MMKWIQNLTYSRIPFFIYKLRTNDTIIYNKYTFHNHKRRLLILKGGIYLLKVFSNEEAICIGLLTCDTILEAKENILLNNQYYRAIAISETFILSFDMNPNTANASIIYGLLKSYQLTFYQSEKILDILVHKNAYKRILQLLFILCEDFGIVHTSYIKLPFKLSHANISEIIGSNRITVARIMKEMRNQKLITYGRKNIYIDKSLTIVYSYAKNKLSK